MDWLESVDWSEWIRAVGPLAAALVALLLGLGLRDWIYKPKLTLTSEDADPSARIVMRLSDGRDGGWARIRVANIGRATARNVRARFLSIERFDDGQWVPERSELDARSLAWANTPPSEPVDIPTATARPLDLLSVRRVGHGTDAHATLSIATGVGFPPLIGYISRPLSGAVEYQLQAESPETPTSNAHVFESAGSWRIALLIAGDNVKASSVYIGIGFSAQWWAPESGELWRNTVRIGGPTADAPSAPVLAPSDIDLLVAALAEDAKRKEA